MFVYLNKKCRLLAYTVLVKSKHMLNRSRVKLEFQHAGPVEDSDQHVHPCSVISFQWMLYGQRLKAETEIVNSFVTLQHDLPLLCTQLEP